MESSLLDQVDEKSEEIKDVLEKTPSSLITWATSIITAILILFVFLCSLIKYPDVINADITITSSNPPIRLFSKSEGKIAKFFVKDERLVKENEILLLLDNTANFDHVLKVQELVKELNITDILKNNNNLTDTFQLGELQNFYNSFFSSYKQYLFFLKHQPYQNEISNYYLLLNKYKNLSESNQKAFKIKQQQCAITDRDLHRHRQLHNQKLISDVEYEEKQSKAFESQNEMENALLNLKGTEAKISEINLNIEKLKILHFESENNFKNSLYSDFHNFKSELKEWESKYVIKSPIEGKVTLNRYWQNFQNVKKGEEIISVIPNNTGTIIGKVIMPITNSGKVKKGNKGFIYLKNFPYQEFGSLNAIIERISLIPNDEFYSIELSLPNKLTTNYKMKLDFNQEMKGNVEIITEDLSLLQRIFYSFNSLFKYNK